MLRAAQNVNQAEKQVPYFIENNERGRARRAWGLWDMSGAWPRGNPLWCNLVASGCWSQPLKSHSSHAHRARPCSLFSKKYRYCSSGRVEPTLKVTTKEVKILYEWKRKWTAKICSGGQFEWYSVIDIKALFKRQGKKDDMPRNPGNAKRYTFVAKTALFKSTKKWI